MTEQLTIKPDKKRFLLFFLMISVFMVVGLGLMMLPPHKTSIIPLARFLQPIVGCVSILFSLVGYTALLLRMQKPIISLNEKAFHDHVHHVTIPWEDIRDVEMVRKWGNHKVRWLYVYTLDPEKYKEFDRLNKRYGSTNADLVIDFSLASQADFEKAYNLLKGAFQMS